jgi:hypothetical protein
LDVDDQIYTQAGVYFDTLKYLNEIGLISLETIGRFARTKLPQKVVVTYCGQGVTITFPEPQDNQLNVETVLLSKAGQELASICGSAPVPGFLDYTINRCKSEGLQIAELTQSPDVVQ